MLVFISHAKDDAHYADQLENAMRPGGFRAWRFQRDMVGGKAWDPQIPANIETCGIFLLATTENYLNSITCKREWQHASLIEKPLVPIVLKRGVYPPSPINDHQYVYFDGSDESGARLIVALQNAQPLPWEKIPKDWETWHGKTKVELRGAHNELTAMRIPKVRRQTTDVVRNDFLYEAIGGIQENFSKALMAFEESDSRIETHICDDNETGFRCYVHVNGKLARACWLRIGEYFSQSGIGYSDSVGQPTSFAKEEYNQFAQVIEVDGRPALEFMLTLISFGESIDRRIWTVDEASQHFWAYFVWDFQDNSE